VNAALLLPMIDLNPFDWAGDKIEEGLADAFTAMMMAVWSAGLWLIDMVFGVIDRFATPDVTSPGLGPLYSLTLWLSFVIALMIGLGQVGLAALRRDGSSLASLAMGIAQYGAVVSGWMVVCAGLIVGSAGLTKGLLQELLNVDGFAGYSASAGMPNQVSGTVQAAVLGISSLFMVIPASFGYLLIMLVREAGLLILTATMPIAAAGALGEGTRTWMWKSIRWFVAACLTAPLLALVIGVSVQISRAAFTDTATDEQPAGQVASEVIRANESHVGMAVVGCVILLVACFCPMVLFRLLAFVDPGTASGASFRTNLAANGGVAGLISGRGATADQGSGAATQVAPDGRSASESGADAETANRFQSRAARAFGVAGQAVGKTMDSIGSVAATGASMSVDVMGQAGVGHQGYYDTTPPRRRGKPYPQPNRVGHGYDHDGGGVANDPAHIANADEAAAAAEDGAMLA
jgi:type IV secretion system protein TrbL